MKTTKKLFMFQETEFSKILGKENPKKTSCIFGGNILVSKKEAKASLKKSLIFREMELSGPKFKKFLI